MIIPSIKLTPPKYDNPIIVLVGLLILALTGFQIWDLEKYALSIGKDGLLFGLSFTALAGIVTACVFIVTGRKITK